MSAPCSRVHDLGCNHMRCPSGPPVKFGIEFSHVLGPSGTRLTVPLGLICGVYTVVGFAIFQLSE